MAHAEFPLLSVRLVIGTKGQRVKQIEAQSGARVRFDTSEPVRAMIRGSDEARAKAWELLQAVESESQARVPCAP
jgi:polyribonucleotide nucleotidyltransferase